MGIVLVVLLALVVALLLTSRLTLQPTLRKAGPHELARTATIDAIENLLPQTQCGQCGYLGCRPYADAIAQGEHINRCPPGGDRTIAALATLLHTDTLPLDSAPPPPRSIAYIREAECIGCTKCIQACPVDAIVGAAKLMHTVIVAECTGCDLCVEPCPVDCIEMRPLPQTLPRIGMPTPTVIASDRARRLA
jgi:electron transport complex protein RnfB